MVGTVVRISTEWQAIELSADDLLPLGDIDTASHPQVVPAVASDNSGDFKESLVPFFVEWALHGRGSYARQTQCDVVRSRAALEG